MDDLEIERIGGLAGMGLPGSRLRSRGRLALSSLSAADRQAVDALFEAPAPPPDNMRDGFRYRLTRRTAAGVQTVEMPESAIPAAVSGSIRDELI